MKWLVHSTRFLIHKQPEQPTAFSPELASRRAEFKVEELVEFLYSAADNDQVLFNNWSTD